MQESPNEATIYNLRINEIDIKEIKDCIFSSTINKPLMRLGYHYYQSRTRNDMVQFTKLITGDNKFYFVINPFEPIIPNYQDNIVKMASIYLNNDKIYNRGFFKMWEMCYIYGLVEGEGEYICSTFDRENSDFAMAVESYNSKLVNRKVIINQLNNDFYKEVSKLKTKSNLIIGNCKLNLEADESQEQYHYQVILAEIISGLKIQKAKGHFILRVFDTFTLPTIKLISILSSFYTKVSIYKPYFSRKTSGERYIVCREFKNPSNLSLYIEQLDTIYQEMEKNKTKFIFDICPNLKLTDEYVKSFTFINTKLINPQLIIINKIITFIKDNNYYGDKYHKYRENQIQAIEWWLKVFFPPSKNLFEKNKSEIINHIASIENIHNMEEKEFIGNLI
jgi:hypothetical protein